jgi:hypothetical protein
MGNSMVLVLVGGAVSLFSTIAGMIVQHMLEMRKVRHQLREHPFTVLYNKQTEFLELLAPVLGNVNSFITEIDACLAGGTPGGVRKARTAASDNGILIKFDDLLQRYHAFLPAELVREAGSLLAESLRLSESPTTGQASRCMAQLFDFQNGVRGFVGVDALTEDLMGTLGKATKGSKGGT